MRRVPELSERHGDDFGVTLKAHAPRTRLYDRTRDGIRTSCLGKSDWNAPLTEDKSQILACNGNRKAFKHLDDFWSG